MLRGARGGKSEYSAQFKGRRRSAAAREEGGGGGRRDDFQIYCGKLKECRRPRARVPARLCVCVCACALRFNPLSFRAFSARALLCV